jgi:hypothetical protein
MMDEVDPKADFAVEDCLNLAGFQNLLIKMSEPFQKKIRLSSPVKLVDYSKDIIKITTANGDVIEAEKVIMYVLHRYCNHIATRTTNTSPIWYLSRAIPDHLLVEGGIEFTPALPTMFPLLASFSGITYHLQMYWGSSLTILFVFRGTFIRKGAVHEGVSALPDILLGGPGRPGVLCLHPPD